MAVDVISSPARAAICCTGCRACREGHTAKCRRCGDVLRRRPRNGRERTLALAFASSVLFVVANSFPFLAFDMKGLSTQTTLLTGVVDLWQAGKQEIAALVFLTIELAPALQIALLLWVLGPLRFGQRPWLLPRAFRLLRHAQTWSMLEVFLIGILVAIVKLLGNGERRARARALVVRAADRRAHRARSRRSIPRKSGRQLEAQR